MDTHDRDEARPLTAPRWPRAPFPGWGLLVQLCVDLDVVCLGAPAGNGPQFIEHIAKSLCVVASDGSDGAAAVMDALAALADGSVDCVLLEMSALRGEGGRRQLAEIRRVLRGGGFLLVASERAPTDWASPGDHESLRAIGESFSTCLNVKIDVALDQIAGSRSLDGEQAHRSDRPPAGEPPATAPVPVQDVPGFSFARSAKGGLPHSKRASARWHLACNGPVPQLLREVLWTESGSSAPVDEDPEHDQLTRIRQMQRELVDLNTALVLSHRSRKDRFKESAAYAALREIERVIRRTLRGQKPVPESHEGRPRQGGSVGRLLTLLKRRLRGNFVSLDALDYVWERHGEAFVDLYDDLLMVVGRYSAQRASFAASGDCARLLDEARGLARGREKDKPDASIIIPVYNGLHLTLTCIVSILKTMGEATLEVIVADDRSSDETAQVIASIGGCVRHIRQDANLGFLDNCNAAARHALGRHLVFLNNDTLVLPNWLDTLVRVLDANPSVGLVGSKLLNVDGTLQEAGGIFWHDGSAWNFGRNQDPRLPAFNYVKEVDYISGASIAIPATVWQEMEGFDPLYAPAYCEDADFAFRLRQRGYKVIYQPYSEVFHHEGQSHGVATNAGIKSYQVINLKTFRERWRGTLEAEHFKVGTNIFEARDRSRGRPHIVIIDHYIPQPDRDAGSRSIHMYIRLFVEAGFQVSFWADNLFADPDYKPLYEQMGVEVMCGASCRNRFASWLAERADKVGYVLLSRPHIAMGYLQAVARFPAIKRLYYGHDVHFQRMEREFAVTARPALVDEIPRMRQLEESIIKSCDVVIYPNQDEVAFAANLAPHVESILLPVFLVEEGRLAQAERRIVPSGGRALAHLLFVGGFAHLPNVDGVMWLVGEVLPRLTEMGIGFHLTIVGSNMPDTIRNLAGPGVEPRGWVSDAELDELYAAADLSVAPLRFGGGVKGKIIEALARGIPLVTGSVGMQGIPDPDRLVLIADTAEDFARAIGNVLTDPAAAAERTRNGIAFLRQNYTVSAARAALARCIPELR